MKKIHRGYMYICRDLAQWAPLWTHEHIWEQEFLEAHFGKAVTIICTCRCRHEVLYLYEDLLDAYMHARACWRSICCIACVFCIFCMLLRRSKRWMRGRRADEDVIRVYFCSIRINVNMNVKAAKDVLL